MDIIEFAMKMELDGKSYYETQAKASGNKQLRQIFETLAEEEMKHFKFFKRIRDGEVEEAAGELGGSATALQKVQNIFVELSQQKRTGPFGDGELEAWSKALEIEEKAEKFYREKASIEKDALNKKLLNRIADEERNHVHMIDGILTYLKFPDEFADSAAFKNFQSLEGH